MHVEKNKPKNESANNELLHDNSYRLIMNYTIIEKRGVNETEIFEKYKKLCTTMKKGNDEYHYKVKHTQVELIRTMIERKARSDRQELKDIDLIKNLDHPYIPKIFEIYKGESPLQKTFIVEEYFDGRPLKDEIADIGMFNEELTAYIIYQLLIVVNYLRSMKIAHLNINPNSVLLSSLLNGENEIYEVKLTHFFDYICYDEPKSIENFKLNYERYRKNEFFNFYPPELFKPNLDEDDKNIIYKKADIYSIGKIGYYMLNGGKKESKKHNEINRICSEGKLLLEKLTLEDPSKRISASNALKSKWFSKMKVKSFTNSIEKKDFRKIYRNIINFKSDNKMYLAAISYLVHNIPDIEEIRVINHLHMFCSGDNNNGRMEKEEFIKGFQNFSNLGYKPSDIENKINEVFNIMDEDKSGYIEFEEFARAGIDKNLFDEEVVLRFAYDFLCSNSQKNKILFVGDLSKDTTVMNNFLSDRQNIRNIQILKILEDLKISKYKEDDFCVVSFEQFKIMMLNLLSKKYKLK